MRASQRRDPKVGRLRRLRLLRACDERGVRRIASCVDEIPVAPGEHLCRQGHQASEMYIVVDGDLDVVVDGVTVAAVGPGQLVGEVAVLTGGTRTATVTARSPVRALVLPSRFFWPMFEDLAGLRHGVAVDLVGKVRSRAGTRSSGWGASAG